MTADARLGPSGTWDTLDADGAAIDPIMNGVCEVARTILAQLVGEALLELVENYQEGASAVHDDAACAARLSCSIGLAGEGLDGSITLAAPETAILALYPRGVAQAPSDKMVADWTGELTNQLAGRLKTKLAMRGATITIGIPKLLTPVPGPCGPSPRVDNSTWHVLDVLHSAFHALLEVGVHHDLRLDTIVRPPEPAAAEGELLFF